MCGALRIGKRGRSAAAGRKNRRIKANIVEPFKNFKSVNQYCRLRML